MDKASKQEHEANEEVKELLKTIPGTCTLKLQSNLSIHIFHKYSQYATFTCRDTIMYFNFVDVFSYINVLD